MTASHLLESAIIDNIDPGYSDVGSWQGDNRQNAYGGSHRYHAPALLPEDVIILDNQQAQLTGQWNWHGTPDAYNNGFHWTPVGTGTKTARWQTSITPGRYTLYARWGAHPTHVSDARYRIDHLNDQGQATTTEVLHNQQQNGHSWQPLGEFEFGNDAVITLPDIGTGSAVIADAVMLIPETTATNDRAEWHYTATADGEYHLAIYWETDPPWRTNTALYRIIHTPADGGPVQIHSTVVNQKDDGMNWQSAYTLPLMAGDQVTVSLTGGPDNYVIADAIRWQWSGTDISLTWPAAVAREGDYQVSARWPVDASHTDAATYRIQHTQGITDITVNQQQNGGAWQSLGNFRLNASSGVTLVHSGELKTIADGLRLDWQSDAAPPTPGGSLNTTASRYFIHTDHLGHPPGTDGRQPNHRLAGRLSALWGSPSG